MIFKLFHGFPRAGALAAIAVFASATSVWAENGAVNLAEELARAEARVTEWDGPVTGPKGAVGKQIVYISWDLRNGGILGVANGVREAAKVLGWNFKILDLRGGGEQAAAKAVAEAMEMNADGVIIGGMDAVKFAAAWEPLARKKVPVLAWHAGAEGGAIPDTPVLWNVTTDPLKVARIAAQAAVASRKGNAGFVIFTDSNIGIAVTKSKAMAEIIRASPGCELLEICDVHLEGAAEQMPKVTQELLSKYGKRWTHALGINDLYFDHATPVLAAAGLASDSAISCISAGDGSVSAYVRIQAGLYQTATVAEPLNLQGWQLVDEMNRLFSGAPLSGYVTPTHLVNSKNIAHDGGAQRRFDPDNGYRDAYRKIWGR